MTIITDVKNFTLTQEHAIKDGLECLNLSTFQIILICNDDNVLVGTITDGDIRRALLQGATLDSKLSIAMNTEPVTANEESSLTSLKNSAIKHNIRHIPLLNAQNVIVGVYFSGPLHNTQNNYVVLMLGGLGTRLKPLTHNYPKPMLKVGDVPILETIIQNLSSQGFTNFIFCVNYMSNIIEEYFQDGTRFGINIEYIKEQQPLGTAGALALINKKFREPIIIMNGDILAHIDFRHLLNFHKEQNANITSSIREQIYQIPYGVVKLNKTEIIKTDEKPSKSFFVNAGIYVIEPSLLDTIPKNMFYDMPDLINHCISDSDKVVGYPLTDYWKDIGMHEDYNQANLDYNKHFGNHARKD